jgi:hypothetical protein
MCSAVLIHHSAFDGIIYRTLLAFTLAMTVPCAQPQSFVDAGTATLSGTVVDSSGAVIPKAILSLEKTDSPHLQTTTDSSGHFAIEAAPGEYILNVSAYGFQASKIEVGLSAGTHNMGKILLSVSMDACGVCVTQVIPIDTINASLDVLLPLSPLPPYKFATRNAKHLRS